MSSQGIRRRFSRLHRLRLPAVVGPDGAFNRPRSFGRTAIAVCVLVKPVLNERSADREQTSQVGEVPEDLAGIESSSTELMCEW